MKRLMFVILLAMLTLPAAAQADRGEGALRVAQEYWGTSHPPDCATQVIHWGESGPYWSGRPASATAVQEPNQMCEMWVDAKGLNTYTLCVLVVHEYGHWMGYQWGTDPHSITFDGDQYGDWWGPPTIGRCAKLAHYHNLELQAF